MKNLSPKQLEKVKLEHELLIKNINVVEKWAREHEKEVLQNIKNTSEWVLMEIDWILSGE